MSPLARPPVNKQTTTALPPLKPEASVTSGGAEKSDRSELEMLEDDLRVLQAYLDAQEHSLRYQKEDCFRKLKDGIITSPLGANNVKGANSNMCSFSSR